MHSPSRAFVILRGTGDCRNHHPIADSHKVDIPLDGAVADLPDTAAALPGDVVGILLGDVAVALHIAGIHHTPGWGNLGNAEVVMAVMAAMHCNTTQPPPEIVFLRILAGGKFVDRRTDIGLLLRHHS